MMRTDLDKPGTWVLFKPSLCQQCQADCCRMPVDASISDLIRMGVLTEDEGLWSASKIGRKLISEKIIVSFRASKMLFQIAQKANRDCVFLGTDRRCTIYERRPNVCRRFPEVGPRPGFCPANKGLRSTKAK